MTDQPVLAVRFFTILRHCGALCILKPGDGVKLACFCLQLRYALQRHLARIGAARLDRRSSLHYYLKISAQIEKNGTKQCSHCQAAIAAQAQQQARECSYEPS